MVDEVGMCLKSHVFAVPQIAGGSNPTHALFDSLRRMDTAGTESQLNVEQPTPQTDLTIRAPIGLGLSSVTRRSVILPRATSFRQRKTPNKSIHP